MLLGILGATLLGNLSGKGTVRAGEVIVRASYGSSIKKALIPPHPLTNFEKKSIYLSLDLMVFSLEIIYLKR